MTENPIRPLVCPNIIKEEKKKASWVGFFFFFVQDKLNLHPQKQNILAMSFSKNPHHHSSLNYSKSDCNLRGRGNAKLEPVTNGQLVSGDESI